MSLNSTTDSDTNDDDVNGNNFIIQQLYKADEGLD